MSESAHDTTIHSPLDTIVVKTKYLHSWRKRHGQALRLNNLVALLASVSGRDKVYRLIQSAIKLSAYTCQKLQDQLKTAERLLQIANGFSWGRRFIRIGHAPGAARAIVDGLKSDTTELGFLYWTLLSRVFGLLFLLIDHIGFVARLGILTINYELEGVRLSVLSFGNTLFQIFSDICSIVFIRRKRALLAQQLETQTPTDEETNKQLLNELDSLNARYQSYKYNCVRNSLDIPGQLNGVFRWESVPPIAWTCLSFISSTIGVWQSWPSKVDSLQNAIAKASGILYATSLGPRARVRL